MTNILTSVCNLRQVLAQEVHPYRGLTLVITPCEAIAHSINCRSHEMVPTSFPGSRTRTILSAISRLNRHTTVTSITRSRIPRPESLRGPVRLSRPLSVYLSPHLSPSASVSRSLAPPSSPAPPPPCVRGQQEAESGLAPSRLATPEAENG